MDKEKCFNCGAEEDQIPLVNLRFDTKQIWICPQCIPNLIHNPHLVDDRLKDLKDED